MISGETPVRVWDVPVRLFHWLLVVLFAFMLISGKIKGDWMEWHMRSGYAILALVLFRILWGFAGSGYARFSSFLAGPSAFLRFAKMLLTRTPAPSAGHNPLGGWMVLVLLLSLLIQTGTGLFANDDILIEGPLASLVSKALSDRLTGWHHLNLKLLLVLAAVHILAVLYHKLFMKENLIGAMFTGVKYLPADAVAGSTPARFASPWLALVLLLVAAFAVYLIVNRPF
jgi:cytochrome b